MTKKELIASSHTREEIRKYITADSLAYLSLDGMVSAAPGIPSSIAMPVLLSAIPFLLPGRRNFNSGCLKRRADRIPGCFRRSSGLPSMPC